MTNDFSHLNFESGSHYGILFVPFLVDGTLRAHEQRHWRGLDANLLKEVTCASDKMLSVLHRVL